MMGEHDPLLEPNPAGFPFGATPRQSNSAPRVALVSMPWASLQEPSLGLAILKAQLAAQGIEARVFHANLQLLRHVTSNLYRDVAECYGLNEFVFTSILDQGLDQAQVDCLMERCIAHVLTNLRHTLRDPADFGRALIRMRHEAVPKYLSECADQILAYEPTMVGFTCLFDQVAASAALATLLRARRPDLLIVFGGYALEGPPGLEALRACPAMDAVVLGDGEPVISALAQTSIGRQRLNEIPGVLTRENPKGLPRAKYEVDASPPPDYSDWFDDLARLKEQDKITVRTFNLPIESSRGCWWGQKQHCTFCGIDDATLQYRQKRPATVLDLLAEMRRRHGVSYSFRFSDYILPHSYWQDLLPSLAQQDPRFVLSCEIKANQNEARMKGLADAGFVAVQPGVESFDSNVLKLMKKGVTGIHNVLCIKLGYLHRVDIIYNILVGFPGEKPEWYRAMTSRLPHIHHLIPPVGRTEVVVTRFAPLHEDTGLVGIRNAPKHHRGYDVMFSEEFLQRTGFSLDDYAYYFERHYDVSPELTNLHWELVYAVDGWKREHLLRDVFLTWERTEESSEEAPGLVIRDSRLGEPREFGLNEFQSRVYLACDGAPRTVAWLADELLKADATDGDLEETLSFLEQERLIWREEEQVLGLAVPEAVAQRHAASGWKRNWTALNP